ncbi:hypothetical protein [Rhodococcus sp. ACT016]|uniref:hypothetical protein n=1 Tax=Rhodococcus sp. ACT016 TaxID=3134808 RepID=UPI003D2834A7
MRKSIAAGVVAAASVGVILGGTGIASAASKTVPEGWGIYSVNSKIRPGTYATEGGLDGKQTCTWVRGKVRLAHIESIASGKSTGPTTVKIEDTDDVFITNGCSGWKLVTPQDGGFLHSGSLSGSLDFGSLTDGLVGSLEAGAAAGSLGGSLGGALATGSLVNGSSQNGSSGS